MRDRKPFAATPSEIAELAAQVSDDSFRVEIAEDGLHVYNRHGHHVAGEPYAIFPHLQVEGDGGHAFYLGVELAKAQIAWQLGKRYVQDRPLNWGSAVDEEAEDLTTFKEVGPTLPAKRQKRHRA